MSNQLAVIQSNQHEVLPSPQQWATMMEMASTLVKSGLLPKSIDTPAKATAVILKGRELGIPAMQSFAHIYIIEGKPTCSSELLLALLARGGVTWNWVADGSGDAAEITFNRQGFASFTSSFSMEDAKRANLLNKQTWKSYPANMLRARAISNGARMIGPDLLAGMSYTPEELGVEVDEEERPLIAANASRTAIEVADVSKVPEQTMTAPMAPADLRVKLDGAKEKLRQDFPGEDTEDAIKWVAEVDDTEALEALRSFYRQQFKELCNMIFKMELQCYPVEKAVKAARAKYVGSDTDSERWEYGKLSALKAYLAHMNEKIAKDTKVEMVEKEMDGEKELAF